jgi:hypothetical protein
VPDIGGVVLPSFYFSGAEVEGWWMCEKFSFFLFVVVLLTITIFRYPRAQYRRGSATVIVFQRSVGRGLLFFSYFILFY